MRPSLSLLMASFHAREGREVRESEAKVPTINQMVRRGRKNKRAKSKAPAFQYTLNSHKATACASGAAAPRRSGECARLCGR